MLAAHIAECARGTRRMGSRARRMGSRKPPNGLAKSSRRTCSRKSAEKTLTFQSQNSEESPFSRRTCSRRPPNGLECEELGSIGSAGPGPGGRTDGRKAGRRADGLTDGRTGGRGVLNDSITIFTDFHKNRRTKSCFLTFRVTRKRKYRFL